MFALFLVCSYLVVAPYELSINMTMGCYSYHTRQRAQSDFGLGLYIVSMNETLNNQMFDRNIFNVWRRQHTPPATSSGPSDPSSIPQNLYQIRRQLIYSDLPPLQPRAQTWDGSYPVRQSIVLPQQVYYVDYVDLESLYAYARQLRYRLMCLKVDAPQKPMHQCPESLFVSATFVIPHNHIAPLPKTHDAQEESTWDGLLVYETYGLVARIIRQATKSIPLRHGWPFIGYL